jgi:flagellar basal-body rod modification protein FlgD
MDPIGSASTTASPPATTASAVAAKGQLGKDDFLKLLTAQLANQDPLQPVDNQAFIAQLAQFSSLEQLQGVSSRLDSLLQATATASQLQTSALVGKTVSYRVGGVEGSGVVRGVDLTGGTPQLLVGAGRVPLSDVLQVTQS